MKTEKPKIIQLSAVSWGSSKKINSCLYGLTSDGKVLQYIPARCQEDAGWKRLNMGSAALQTHGACENDLVTDNPW